MYDEIAVTFFSFETLNNLYFPQYAYAYGGYDRGKLVA